MKAFSCICKAVRVLSILGRGLTNPNLFFRHTLISIIKDYFTSDDSQIYSKHIN